MSTTYIVLANNAWKTKPVAVLTDHQYWAIHENELREWCILTLTKGSTAFEGSVIEFENDKELILFTLRWG